MWLQCAIYARIIVTAGMQIDQPDLPTGTPRAPRLTQALTTASPLSQKLLRISGAPACHWLTTRIKPVAAPVQYVRFLITARVTKPPSVRFPAERVKPGKERSSGFQTEVIVAFPSAALSGGSEPFG